MSDDIQKQYKPFYIKGNCNECSHKKNCPKMKGQNICYSILKKRGEWVEIKQNRKCQ